MAGKPPRKPGRSRFGEAARSAFPISHNNRAKFRLDQRHYCPPSIRRQLSTRRHDRCQVVIVIRQDDTRVTPRAGMRAALPVGSLLGLTQLNTIPSRYNDSGVEGFESLIAHLQSENPRSSEGFSFSTVNGGSVFNFALQELDFFGGEIEQAKDASVEFGFGFGEFAGLAFDSGSVFGEVGFPFVGGARGFERAGGEVEARLEGVAEFGQ